MKWMSCLIMLMMAGCIGLQSGTSFDYLGIPEQESYPNTKAQPIETVSGRYWRISEVADAPYADYLSAVSNGTAKFVEQAQGCVYFSTEMTGDFEQSAGIRAWVTVLYRWKAKPDLVFLGTVQSIESSTTAESLANWVVTFRIDRIQSGKFGGKTFSFRIHSHSKSGLETGKQYVVEAAKTTTGYSVDQYQWTNRTHYQAPDTVRKIAEPQR